jgi:hypothetical protein
MVRASKVVDEAPNDEEHQHEESEEHQHRPENAEKRKCVRQHAFSSFRSSLRCSL